MGLNIKNEEVDRLVTEVARITGESKTEAIRQALLERRAKLMSEDERAAKVREGFRYLETEVWPKLSPEARRPWTREEEDEFFGYGPDGTFI